VSEFMKRLEAGPVPFLISREVSKFQERHRDLTNCSHCYRHFEACMKSEDLFRMEILGGNRDGHSVNYFYSFFKSTAPSRSASHQGGIGFKTAFHSGLEKLSANISDVAGNSALLRHCRHTQCRMQNDE
jgi:hypothetical protein